MAKPIIEARVIQKVGTAQEWSNNDFVLMDGEMGFERTSTGLPVNFKVGEGDKRYSQLPYFHPYIINGSISTTQTISELNALSNGVYSAKGAGTYANGLTANEGQYTTFRKDDDGWHLDARVDVTWESPDLTSIDNQLDNHEQRITDNENRIQYLTDYTQGKAQALADLTTKVNNLQDKDVKIGANNRYPELDNPTTQNSFNRRIFNYVKNSLASSSNFKTNTYNNVTNQFGFGSSSFVFSQEVDGTPYISTGGVKTTFGVDYLRHGSSEDNYIELSAGYVSGKANGVNWNIKKDDSQTQASNIQLPITGNTFRTAIISVNGEFADENGNIVVSGGGGGYILPPASAGTLGGVKVGSGLTITPDGVLSAVGATYTAGNGVNISDENVISVNFGTTSTTATRGDDSRVNNGQTAFTWGNHATQGYIKNNFYTIDGTLTSNRNVNLDGYTLSFQNGNFKAPKYTLEVLTDNMTPNTIWAKENELYHTNSSGVSKKLLTESSALQEVVTVTTNIDLTSSMINKNILFDNGVLNLSLIVPSSLPENFIMSGIKIGSGRLTIVGGAGVTINQITYTDVVYGVVGSRFMLSRAGSSNVFNLYVSNYE